MERLTDILRENGMTVLRDLPLSAHSSFRIGGNARFAVFPKTEEQLLAALRAVRACKVAYRVIGKASNVVFSDEGFAGLVIFTGKCDAVTVQDKTVTAAAGVGVTELSRIAQSTGLAG